MLGAGGGGGGSGRRASVAERGPRELAGECVPALDALVLVLQAVKPVLQALPLGVDAQNHATCGRTGGAAGAQGPPTPRRGTRAPSQVLCSKASLSHCLLGSEHEQDLPSMPHSSPVRAQPSCPSSTRAGIGAGCRGSVRGQGMGPEEGRKAPLCAATRPTRNLGPLGFRVQPEALPIIVSCLCSTTQCCVALPERLPSLGLSLPRAQRSGWRRSEAPQVWGQVVRGSSFPQGPGRRGCGLIQDRHTARRCSHCAPLPIKSLDFPMS